MQNQLNEIVARANPVLLITGAVFLCILGVLVIAFPVILAWAFGVGVILGGVALLATALLSQRN